MNSVPVYAERVSTTRDGETLPIHHDGAEDRFLGRIVPARTAKINRQWASSNPVIPLSQIPDFDYINPALPILDQGQVGSCVGHGCAKALMVARASGGQAYVPLSPDGLYSHINGGRDQGAAPSDGVNWMCSKGVETLADVPDTYILESKIPAAALQTALRFRIAQGDVYQLNSFAECVTASFFGYAVILTVNVGGQFAPAQGTGLVNFTGGVANHCVMASGKWVSSGGYYWFDNSWTPQWGINGRGSIQAIHIDKQPMSDLWAVKTAMIDPQDTDQPPV